MRKSRRRFTERFVNQNLFVRVRQMVLPANDVRDMHFNVVANDRVIVKRMTVRTKQNKVFDFRIISFLQTINRVFKLRFSAWRNFQANPKRLSRVGAFIGFFLRQITKRIIAHIFLLARAFDNRSFYVFIASLFIRRKITIRFSFFQ